MKPDKIYLSLTLIIILTTVSWITSCTHKANIADLPEICFGRDVLPIFVNNCAISGCHDGGKRSRMALNSYADISKNVAPGNPDGSSLYERIIAKSGDRMPPGQPLTLANRTIIRVWIEQGAALTACSDTTVKSFSGGALNNGLITDF